ncbi:MAG TPA: hypothetical protein VNO50_06465 [Pyrinomonadaceae bacterium]|nr:hypothetical protein [Pyrinomonadaceae bacterium]
MSTTYYNSVKINSAAEEWSCTMPAAILLSRSWGWTIWSIAEVATRNGPVDEFFFFQRVEKHAAW